MKKKEREREREEIKSPTTRTEIIKKRNWEVGLESEEREEEEEEERYTFKKSGGAEK